MKFPLCCLFLLVSSTRVLAASLPRHASPAETARLIIDETKAAAGGDRWDAVQEIDGEGEKTSFGLSGGFRTRGQLTTGFFTHEAKYSIFSNAEGLDRNGRWRLDNSGQIHPLNSDEAKTVALSESYISSRGYFYPGRFTASFDACKLPSRPQQSCVWVTPKGGRALALWIDASTHQIERIEMELSVGSESVQYGDYRSVDGILLPFTIVVDHGDESESGTAHMSAYHLMTAGSTNEIIRPQVTFTDTGIGSGAAETTTRGYLDQPSGFFIVEARINGQGPYPFILDTGGHDILTPEMARRIGLPAIGKGFSTGAGAGSSPTEFTSVSTLSIGEAEMRKQPFTILHINLGTTAAAKGKRAPIAGILGLEVFERFAITMDYKAQTVTLRPVDPFEYHGTGTGVPLRFTSDMPLCAASIEGHLGVFGIDTGNNTEVIVYHPWAVENGLGPHQHASGMEGDSVGGGLKLARGHIQKFVIGGFDLGALDVLFSSDTSGSLSARAEAGNVGNSILSGFTVTFAFQLGTMYLEHDDR